MKKETNPYEGMSKTELYRRYFEMLRYHTSGKEYRQLHKALKAYGSEYGVDFYYRYREIIVVAIALVISGVAIVLLSILGLI